MWLAPGWMCPAFVICAPCYPQLGVVDLPHRGGWHGAHRRRSNLSRCCSTIGFNSLRNSRATNDQLLATPRSTGVLRAIHAAGTAVPLVRKASSSASQRQSPASSLTIAILESTLGVDFSPRQLRNIADSPAGQDLDFRLGNGGGGASRIEAGLRELLEAVISVVGGGEGGGSCVVKMVAECPALLLYEGRELLAMVQELRDMEGVTEEKIMQLVVELPSIFTLPPAARERVGLFLGEVGLTAEEVGRLAKRHPDVIEKDAGGHARRIVDIFLQDLHVGKVAFRKMVRRLPGLLSLSVTGNVLEKIEFFTKEMGLRNDQIAKMVCAHPQVLFLSLENSIRPIVQWLGSPDPEARLKAQSLAITGAEAEKLSSRPLLSSNAATDTRKDARLDASASDLDGAKGTPECSEEKGVELAGVAATGVNGETGVVLIEMPVYTDGEWDWGLGLDREGRCQVVSKQGDVLWKSVPGNLAKSTAWFVQEVGLGWNDMRKLATRAPTLLSLSVENNLEPTLGFLVKELGMDPTKLRQTIKNQPSLLTLSVASNLRPKAAFFRHELGANERDIAKLLNHSPRVMNASVEGRILPRVQVMRAAGISPTYRHLRAICTFPDVRFSSWMEKLAGSFRPAVSKSSSSSSRRSGDSTTAVTTPIAKAVLSFDVDSGAIATTIAGATTPQGLSPRRGRWLRGDLPRPSVHTKSLAELGISYTVSSRRRGAVAALSAAAEEREAFAPGRAGGKAVVRRVSRGLEVLDLFCGTGGFAMNAAVGKARSALGVDKDTRAVRTATKNAAVNGLGDTISFIKAGVLSFAEEAASKGRAWDLVVLDLPSLPSKSAQSRSRAVNTYTRLAESSSRLVRSGGMLMAVYESTNGIFETSDNMTEAFSSAAARAAGVSLTLIDAAAAIAGDDSSASNGSADGEGDYGVSRSIPLPISRRRVNGGHVEEEVRLLEEDRVQFNCVGDNAAGGRSQAAEGLPLWWALFVCSKAPLARS